jgi:hypothetical protein
MLMNFPIFYGTWKFITAFTKILHWSLSSARSIHSIPPYLIFLRSILILFTHLRLDLPSGLFPSGLLYANIDSTVHYSKMPWFFLHFHVHFTVNHMLLLFPPAMNLPIWLLLPMRVRNIAFWLEVICISVCKTKISKS